MWFANFRYLLSTFAKIKKSRNEVIKTIQEITKFDEFTINQAIEACQDSEGRYSMDTVLNVLMDEVNNTLILIIFLCFCC